MKKPKINPSTATASKLIVARSGPALRQPARLRPFLGLKRLALTNLLRDVGDGWAGLRAGNTIHPQCVRAFPPFDSAATIFLLQIHSTRQRWRTPSTWRRASADLLFVLVAPKRLRR